LFWDKFILTESVLTKEACEVPTRNISQALFI